MTSRLIVEQLEGTLATNQTINVASGHNLIAPGHVIQAKVMRVDTPVAYSVGTAGTEMTDMRILITPKRADSMIFCQFMMFGEGSGTHEYMYRIFKNGAQATGSYPGYNSVQGTNYWSGLSMAIGYETDYNSTPDTRTFFYFDYPGSTASVTYAPALVNSGGSSSTWYMNRTAGSTGTGSYETGVSIGIIWEIAS